jgi:hypothetical protein
MNGLKLILLFVLAAGTALRADPIDEALPLLQAGYPDFAALHYQPGDQLNDLISRSGGKISLIAPETNAPAQPVTASTLPDNILYWRLASFTPKTTWLDVGGQLQQAQPTLAGVILDLRSNVVPGDYKGAAQVLGLFASGDESLFQWTDQTQGHNDVRLLHPLHTPMVVLTNNQTNGAAEALAACLQADGALVVGRATAGRMGLFEDHKLTSGQILHYYTGPVVAMNSNDVFKIRRTPLAWNQPVVPDLSLSVDDQAEKSALALINDNRINEVIQESAERHRMSEAQLVQGNDPEWDSYLSSLEKKPDAHFLLSLPPIHDVVLVSAIDSLKAIQVSQGLTPSSPTATASTSASVQ